jgi:hypothetical protein
MSRADYTFHCTKDGRPCYHRNLNDPAFPRFHAYVTRDQQGLQIDLHFDALDTIEHKGNHGQSWAYEGGRVQQEMNRLCTVIQTGVAYGQVVGIQHPIPAQTKPTKKRSLFDIIFR